MLFRSKSQNLTVMFTNNLLYLPSASYVRDSDPGAADTAVNDSGAPSLRSPVEVGEVNRNRCLQRAWLIEKIDLGMVCRVT